MSVFFCDSDCELWYTKIKEMDIKVIYMPYTIGDKEEIYKMGEGYDEKAFFDILRAGKDAKTQAINCYDYIDYFEPYLKNGEDIMYVHFSSKMSGTFNNLDMAIRELKEKYPDRKITTVDTLSICVGAGAIVYEAAKLHKNGATDEEIVKFVEENRQNFTMYFVVDSLKHLKNGGRISRTSEIVGSALNIKPILYVNPEGSLVNTQKAMGMKKAICILADKVRTLGKDIGDYEITIMHADSIALAKELEAKLKNEYGDKIHTNIQPIGPVIGIHCGPGTIGLVFHSEKR